MNQLYPKDRLWVHILGSSQGIQHSSQLNKCESYRPCSVSIRGSLTTDEPYNTRLTCMLLKEARRSTGMHSETTDLPPQHQATALSSVSTDTLRCDVSAKGTYTLPWKNYLYASLVLLLSVCVLLRLRNWLHLFVWSLQCQAQHIIIIETLTRTEHLRLITRHRTVLGIYI